MGKMRGAISSIIICGNLSISNSLLPHKATKHGIEKTISRAWLYPTVFVSDTEKWRLNVIELGESETNVDSSPSYPEIVRKNLEYPESLNEKTKKNNNDEQKYNTKKKDKPSNAFLFLEAELAATLTAARRTRILSDRSYAKKEAFRPENFKTGPTLDDLCPPPPTDLKERMWISTFYRAGILISSFQLFPHLTSFLCEFITVTPNQLGTITSKFGPGISILYGTFISLTLSILYERQQNIQRNASAETSLLSLLARDMLSVFNEDHDRAVEGSHCILIQILILVRESRGNELMNLIYSDPYAAISDLISEKEVELFEKDNGLGARGSSITNIRDTLKDLVKIRSQRLSDEALALPPFHFSILAGLSLLIILGFTITELPTVAEYGTTSIESSFLFSILCTIYIGFYNFSEDLNDPFRGVYQIRRSSAATSLLQTSLFITNHPMLKETVTFPSSLNEIDFLKSKTIV